MMSEKRNGRFTSSEIFKLMCEGKAKGSFGAPALTYIDEKNIEIKLGRSIDTEITAKETSWGKLCESYVFGKLGLEYKLCSHETIVHPEIDCFAGSPDAEKEDTIVDVKAPATLKSFCKLVDRLYQGFNGEQVIDYIRNEHKDGDKYYFQLVANAILTGKDWAELIVFCPYQSELQAIRELCEMTEGTLQKQVYWINNAADEEMPYLVDGGYYRNINIIRFPVKETEKKLLLDRIRSAEFFLTREPFVV